LLDAVVKHLRRLDGHVVDERVELPEGHWTVRLREGEKVVLERRIRTHPGESLEIAWPIDPR
jgi:hypothetical protein